jgi:PAS domain S-box-containing protein
MLINNHRDISENEHLRFILEAAGIGIWDFDPIEGQVVWDARCRELFGFTEAENVLYKEVLKYIHPEDAGIVDVAVQKALDPGTKSAYEVRYRTLGANGQLRWILSKGKAYFNEDGIAIRFAGTTQDITEAMQDREKAAISEQIAQVALKGSHSGYFRVLLATDEMEYSPGCARILTGDENKYVDHNTLKEYIHPEDRHIRSKAFELSAQTGKLDYELRTIWDDGSIHWVRASGTYFNNTYLTGTIHDTTAEVLARQKLEETEASLLNAIELAELGTWEVDLTTGISQYSERMREWFGYTKDEVIIMGTDNSPICEEDKPRMRAAGLRAVETGVFELEYKLFAAGKERILHAQGKTFYNDKGEAYKILGTTQDVTAQRTLQLSLEQEVQLRTEELLALNEELSATNEELNDANKQLLHSNEELAQYAYVASHDLQEPLRKIRLFSGMLEGQELPTDQQRLINKIAQSAERMSLLIRDLLDFSRLLKTETPIHQVDLSKALSDVISDFELTIEEKQATVRTGRLPVIEAVSLQMNQLFYNLLSNALKFTTPGIAPEIVVDAQVIEHEEVAKYISNPLTYSNYYHITFADNGIGFETKYADQIFEVFKRLHARTAYPGSGIGLALCKRIVGNHNGYINVTSEVGLGTTFHLILPDKCS